MTMTLKGISDRIYANPSDRKRMEKMNAIYYEMADKVKEHHPDLYQEFTNKAADILYCIEPEEAKEIVAGMQPYGEKWTCDTISEFIKGKGQTDVISYYMAMNMAYNDYHNTAVKWNADNPEFYYDIAHDFIDDPDGKSYKLGKYFR